MQEVAVEVPVVTFRRKVLYKDHPRAGTKISIPRWWLGDVDYVLLDIYPDKIVIRRLDEATGE